MVMEVKEGFGKMYIRQLDYHKGMQLLPRARMREVGLGSVHLSVSVSVCSLVPRPSSEKKRGSGR